MHINSKGKGLSNMKGPKITYLKIMKYNSKQNKHIHK